MGWHAAYLWYWQGRSSNMLNLDVYIEKIVLLRRCQVYVKYLIHKNWPQACSVLNLNHQPNFAICPLNFHIVVGTLVKGKLKRNNARVMGRKRSTCNTLNFHMLCPVAPIVPAAFPWYPFLSDIMSWHPVYNLAIIIANSFASVPEFVKNTTCMRGSIPNSFIN